MADEMVENIPLDIPRTVAIKGGRVIDPATNIDEVMDVILIDGKISAVGRDINPPDGSSVFNATGYIVCPGLIDLHVHCFPDGSILGIDPDIYCLSRGVTTVVDAGSAGAKNISKFVTYSKSKKTRIFMFIHASRIGLETAGCASGDHPGELEILSDVNEEECLQCIQSYPDDIVGVKIRLTAQIANEGKHEKESYRRALSMRSKANLPLMVHHIISTVPLEENEEHNVLGAPGSLQQGDVYTHSYHGFKSTIIDTSTNTVLPCVVSAKERGVHFDVGHGNGSFSWKVAELAAERGTLWPDTISTDLHTESSNGPAYDLPTVMTKFLHLGMPLYDIIKATTSTPASIINKGHQIGSLSVGSAGDVTVIKVQDCDVMLEDSQMLLRRIKQRIVPIAAWRGGERVQIFDPWREWPNKNNDYQKHQTREQVFLHVQ